MDLFGLCWTEVATCSMVTCCLMVRLPLVTYFIHCPQITKLVDPVLYQLTPRGKFQLQIFPIGVRQESPPIVSCSDVAKMHVSTQNVFSLIFHIVLHQVHWHLFCHLLYYLCAKNHKFGTCRLSARDDNLGVLLSGPPCIKTFRILYTPNCLQFVNL